MSYLMSRSLCRSLKGGRFYSAQVMRKADAFSEVTTARVNELNVVTADSGAPLARVTFVAKAGSRYENSSNLGVTHAVRHTAYLTNSERSSFTTFKYIEALGANFNAITTRDYGMFTLSCTKNFLGEAFQLVAPLVTRKSFEPFDWRDHNGCSSNIAFDVAQYHDQPNVELMEQLHAAAFRETLGNSLYCPDEFVGSHTPDQIVDFMNAHYRPNRMAVVATGVEHDEVMQLAKQMTFSTRDIKPNDKKATYHGGERRLPRPDLNVTYAAIATEGPSLANMESLSAAVLQHIMGLGPRIKYSDGINGPKLASAIAKTIKSPFTVNGLSVNYSDSGLFGFTVTADPGDMEKVLRTAVTEFASLTKGGISDAEVARGKNQLKADIAMNLENNETILMSLAEQAVGSDKITTMTQVIKMVDSIQTSDVVNVAKKLVNGKPSMAAVGDLSNVPYLDQLLK